MPSKEKYLQKNLPVVCHVVRIINWKPEGTIRDSRQS